jgi:SAM-dependent methyltransferase
VTEAYWQDAALDEAMQEEHRFVWKAMIETVDAPLAGERVLDAGCNRGGFLRMLVDECGIAEGFGYDPAPGAVDDARRLAGRRSLTFEVAETVPDAWHGFDVAFSHEVLYLLHDMPSHAGAIFDALAPGGGYYAVIGVHTASPLMVEWHRANAEELNLPELYDLDEIVEVFQSVGFEAAAARLAVRFIPVGGDGHHDRGRLVDWIEYYYDHKLLLKFRRPDEARPAVAG